MGEMLAWIILFVVGCCAEYQDADGFLKVFLFFFNKKSFNSLLILQFIFIAHFFKTKFLLLTE